MKNLQTLFVIGVIAWAALFKSAAFLGFKLNQNQIIEAQCEQRNYKVNSCQGKCFLSEKLGLQSDKESPANNAFTINLEDLSFLNYLHAFQLLEVLEPSPIHHLHFSQLPKGVISFCWKPPQ